jgi:hypothetical protein
VQVVAVVALTVYQIQQARLEQVVQVAVGLAQTTLVAQVWLVRQILVLVVVVVVQTAHKLILVLAVKA